MKKMKLFIDVHDERNGTFPTGITDQKFSDFYQKYTKICEEEGVISLKTHVSLTDGKAFCLNMASDIKAIKTVHERVGLPYDSISEIKSVAPGDLFFNKQ